MVSKARLDLPEPDRPVMTVSVSRGMSISTSFRLCSRAPRTEILVSMDLVLLLFRVKRQSARHANAACRPTVASGDPCIISLIHRDARSRTMGKKKHKDRDADQHERKADGGAKAGHGHGA